MVFGKLLWRTEELVRLAYRLHRERSIRTTRHLADIRSVAADTRAVALLTVVVWEARRQVAGDGSVRMKYLDVLLGGVAAKVARQTVLAQRAFPARLRCRFQSELARHHEGFIDAFEVGFFFALNHRLSPADRSCAVVVQVAARAS